MARKNPNLFDEAIAAGRTIKLGQRFGTNPKIEAMMLAGDLDGVLETLTELQRAFVDAVVSGENYTNAIKIAGSKSEGDNAIKAGSEMAKNPKIRFCIDGLKRRYVSNFEVTDDYILRKIVSVIDKLEGSSKYDAASILRAAELLGRANGIFRDRQEISGPGGGPIETKDVEDNASAFDGLMDRLKERADKEKDESVSGTNSRKSA